MKKNELTSPVLPMRALSTDGLFFCHGFDSAVGVWWREERKDLVRMVASIKLWKISSEFHSPKLIFDAMSICFQGMDAEVGSGDWPFSRGGFVVMLVFCGREERGMVRIVVSIKLWKISPDFDSPYCYYYANAWSWQHSKYPTRTTMRSAITETMMKQHHLIEGNEAIKMMAWKVMRYYSVGATRCVQTI